MIVGGRYNLSLALAVVLPEVFKGQLIDTHRNTAYLQRMREQAVGGEINRNLYEFKRQQMKHFHFLLISEQFARSKFVSV